MQEAKRPITVEERPDAVRVGTVLHDGVSEFVVEDRQRRGGTMEWLKLRNAELHGPGEGTWFRLHDAGPLFIKNLFSRLPPGRVL